MSSVDWTFHRMLSETVSVQNWSLLKSNQTCTFLCWRGAGTKQGGVTGAKKHFQQLWFTSNLFSAKTATSKLLSASKNSTDSNLAPSDKQQPGGWCSLARLSGLQVHSQHRGWVTLCKSQENNGRPSDRSSPLVVHVEACKEQVGRQAGQ